MDALSCKAIRKTVALVLAGGRECIMRLRKGLRWPDGHPRTADNILFVVCDVVKYAPFAAAGRTP